MVVVCPGCGGRNRLVPAKLHEGARCGRCQTDISPLDRPHPVASAEEFDELLASSSLPVMVDFWAGWCGPCVMVAPEVDRLAALRAGALLVAKVDTEALPDVAARYRIQGIPAFLLFRGGEVARRATGAMPAEGIAQALGL